MESWKKEGGRSEVAAASEMRDLLGNDDNLKESIFDLELSVRAACFLTNNKIFTIRDLIKHSISDLNSLYGCSQKTLREIKDELYRRGLSFSDKGIKPNKHARSIKAYELRCKGLKFREIAVEIGLMPNKADKARELAMQGERVINNSIKILEAVGYTVTRNA